MAAFLPAICVAQGCQVQRRQAVVQSLIWLLGVGPGGSCRHPHVPDAYGRLLVVL
jgi:hypothetical protein